MNHIIAGYVPTSDINAGFMISSLSSTSFTASKIGLDKLCFFSALLFYSLILSINAYYALKLSYYSQNYASIIFVNTILHSAFLYCSIYTLYRSIIISLAMTCWYMSLARWRTFALQLQRMAESV